MLLKESPARAAAYLTDYSGQISLSALDESLDAIRTISDRKVHGSNDYDLKKKESLN